VLVPHNRAWKDPKAEPANLRWPRSLGYRRSVQVPALSRLDGRELRIVTSCHLMLESIPKTVLSCFAGHGMLGVLATLLLQVSNCAALAVWGGVELDHCILS